MRSFGSDNNSGIHPEVLAAIVAANSDHAPGYGDDPWTKKAYKIFEKQFGQNIEVAFTFNGTGANIVALSLATKSFNAVICPKTAHIAVDECGAPEKFSGCKLITVDSIEGKLTPESVLACLSGKGDQHQVQPSLISISQTNELGLVYSPKELRTLTECAHAQGLYVHMDGSRLSNGAASLGLSLRAASRDLGVDVLSLGGTKNGLMAGEAVVVFNEKLFGSLQFVRKQASQLASKMRFLSAQFNALFEGDLWLRNAQHANAMAALLATEVQKLGVKLARPVQANAVFALLPEKQIENLQKRYFFYISNVTCGEVRWMTSFDTSEKDVHEFVSEVRKSC